MARTVSQALDLMRRAIGRRNANDPDATPAILLEYLNDFYSLIMCNDVKLFELYGTLEFTIDENGQNGTNDGVYTWNSLGIDQNYINLVEEGFITLTSQADGSTSWNELSLHQNPNRFFGKWGVNNIDVLTTGYPTELLFYGNELTFRTIPDTSYDVILYAYKQNSDFNENDSIPFDYWLYYLVYGASQLYAANFRVSPETMQNIEKQYQKHRRLVLTRTHEQAKKSRGAPSF